MLRCSEAVVNSSAGEGDEEEELLRAAVHVMHIVPKAANDMMNVGRLHGYNVRYDDDDDDDNNNDKDDNNDNDDENDVDDDDNYDNTENDNDNGK